MESSGSGLSPTTGRRLSSRTLGFLDGFPDRFLLRRLRTLGFPREVTVGLGRDLTDVISRILENGELEMVSAQIGRSEVLVGSVETVDGVTQIHFVSKTITHDPRMVSSMRMLELEGDTLRYEMGMHTTKVERLTPHLQITLQRVK